MSTDDTPSTRTNSFALQDRLFAGITQCFALLVLITLLAILASLLAGAWQTLSQTGPSFFVSSTWDPVRKLFGGVAPLWGTIATATIALLVGVPVSRANPGWLDPCPAGHDHSGSCSTDWRIPRRPRSASSNGGRASAGS